MTRPYQRKSSEQWQSLVEAQQQSGLSAVKFCDQNQVGYASFCKWKQRFSTTPNRNNHKNTTPSDFIDVTSIPTTSGQWHITLVLGDSVELTLSRG